MAIRRPKRAWYGSILWGARWLYRLRLGRVTGEGQENVPRSGPVILAPTHFSTLDPPAVALACPRHLRFMAKIELFKGLFGWAIRSVGAFPVRRGAGDSESIRISLGILADGQALLVFPEGERGDGIHLGKMNPGLAMLAKRSRAPVVPVAIVGSAKTMPDCSRRRSGNPITVAFGPAFCYDDVPGEGGAASRQVFLDELERRLLALCAANGLAMKPRGSGTDSETEHE